MYCHPTSETTITSLSDNTQTCQLITWHN